jgi:hypothetical protein
VISWKKINRIVGENPPLNEGFIQCSSFKYPWVEEKNLVSEGGDTNLSWA